MTMIEEDFEITIKVIVVGNGGIGKTSLIQKFAKGIFTDTYKKTIGVDFLEKRMYIPSLGEDATMMLWDTAGQEEFDAVTRSYYRDAGACVIAFSTTDRASFDDIGKWKKKVEAECGTRLPMVLIQNKIDLIDQAVMTRKEAEDAAKELGLRFYRTCVKENLNVNEVFTYLAEQYVQRRQESAAAEPVAAIGFTAQPKEAPVSTPAAPVPTFTTTATPAAAAAAATTTSATTVSPDTEKAAVPAPPERLPPPVTQFSSQPPPAKVDMAARKRTEVLDMTQPTVPSRHRATKSKFPFSCTLL